MDLCWTKPTRPVINWRHSDRLSTCVCVCVGGGGGGEQKKKKNSGSISPFF